MNKIGDVKVEEFSLCEKCGATYPQHLIGEKCAMPVKKNFGSSDTGYCDSELIYKSYTWKLIDIR